MISISRKTIPYHFGINIAPTFKSLFQIFKDQDP